MEKHITLVGVLNIVYHALGILGALVLLVIAFGFGHFFDMLVEHGQIDMREVPVEVLDIVPAILIMVAGVLTILSIAGIVAAVGVLKRKEWGRIAMLVIAFLSLIRIPLGTLLGIYSIWVLLNNETIVLFGGKAPVMPVVPVAPGA